MHNVSAKSVLVLSIGNDFKNKDLDFTINIDLSDFVNLIESKHKSYKVSFI